MEQNKPNLQDELKENTKRFNHTLKTFFRSLIEAYPSVPAFKLMLTAYKTLKTFNKKLPMSYFRELITPYADMILAGDDSFVKDIQLPADTSFVLRAIVPDLVSLWESAPIDSKKAVEDYMKSLVVLSRNQSKIENL
jgi:hypothetical protein